MRKSEKKLLPRILTCNSTLHSLQAYVRSRRFTATVLYDLQHGGVKLFAEGAATTLFGEEFRASNGSFFTYGDLE